VGSLTSCRKRRRTKDTYDFEVEVQLSAVFFPPLRVLATGGLFTTEHAPNATCPQLTQKLT